MILYHGSNIEVTNINLTKSTQMTDFGTGFYMTSNILQALKWAQMKADIDSGLPIVSAFEVVNKNELSILNLFHDYRTWVEVILKHRTSGGLQHNYDMLMGYVADAGLYITLRKLNSGKITPTDAFNLLTRNKSLVDQYSIHTELAKRSIKPLGRVYGG